MAGPGGTSAPCWQGALPGRHTDLGLHGDECLHDLRRASMLPTGRPVVVAVPNERDAFHHKADDALTHIQGRPGKRVAAWLPGLSKTPRGTL